MKVENLLGPQLQVILYACRINRSSAA